MKTLRRILLSLAVLFLSQTFALCATGPSARVTKDLSVARQVKALTPPPVLKGKPIDIARDLAKRIPYAYLNDQTDLQCMHDRGPEFRWWTKDYFFESSREDQKIKFHWKTDVKNVASAQWQIAVYRYKPGTHDWQHPVGLVNKGSLTSPAAKGSYADFHIDFSKFASQPRTLKEPVGPFVKPAARIGRMMAKTALKAKLAAKAFVPPKQVTYYVRIVPLDKNGKCIGAPSEPVEIIYGEPEPSSITYYPGATGQPDPSKLPKLNHPSVKLLKYHPINEEWWNAVYQFVVIRELPMMPYKIGQELDFTPHKDDKSWWEEVGDFLSDVADFAAGAVNWVADAYQAIKDFAIESVMTVLPEELRGPLTIALDVGLACMGLPPSIPSFSDLTVMGKDYLVRYCAESANIPPEIAGQAVDAFISAAQSTSSGGGGNPAVWLKPNPRAYYRPAYVELEVSNPTSEWTRKVTLRTTADPTNDPEAAQRCEHVFTSEYLDIPALPPGDKFTVPMYLKEYTLMRQLETNPFAGKNRFWQRYNLGGMSIRAYSIAYLPKNENPAAYQNASQTHFTQTLDKCNKQWPQ